MLLGNKSDLEYLREVSAVHSRELAKEFGIKLSFEVSALKEN